MEGSVINRRYRIDREIGSGDMSSVYLGHDLLLDRTIAVKLLHWSLISDASLYERFTREAQAAAGLVHPHIVDIYDVGEHDGRPYIVMQYVEGESLQHLIQTEGPFHPDDVAALVEQVATALDFAHERGVIHRDVKPANILVNADGIAKVVDFGIAHGPSGTSLPALGSWAGTAGYIAPELAYGVEATPCSDVYSLGVVAFEMLTKRRPFQADTASAVLLQHIQHTPPAPSQLSARIPMQLDGIVLRALAKDPAQRYQTAGEFADALTEWRTSSTAAAPYAAGEETYTLPAVSAPSPTPSPLQPPVNAAPATSTTLPTRLTSTPERSGSRTMANTWLIGLIGLAVITGAVTVAAGFSPRLSALFESTQPTSTSAVVVTSGESSRQVDATNMTSARATVPDLTGLSVHDARALLAAEGIELREDPPVFSSSVRSGAIAEQDPPPGTTLAPDSAVFVKTSRGPAQVDLTQLGFTGQPADTVQQRLAELGLAVRREERGSLTVPAGNVVELTPRTVVRPGDTVTLVVSRGDQVQIPRDVFGVPVSQAEATLRELGYEVHDPIGVGRATVERQIDLAEHGIQQGDVVGVQNEEGTAKFGAWLGRGSSVTLVYYDATLDDPAS